MDPINRLGQSSIDWSKQQVFKKLTPSENDTFQLNDKSNSEYVGYDKNKLNKEIESVNAQLESLNPSLRMKFSEEAEQFYVEVIDVRTREVVESIPGKHMIDLAAKLKDMIGFFIDEKR